MIQKRYEYWDSEGGKPVKKFTDWFNYSPHDKLLKAFQKEEKYQIANKLLNEFRVV